MQPTVPGPNILWSYLSINLTERPLPTRCYHSYGVYELEQLPNTMNTLFWRFMNLSQWLVSTQTISPNLIGRNSKLTSGYAMEVLPLYGLCELRYISCKGDNSVLVSVYDQGLGLPNPWYDHNNNGNVQNGSTDEVWMNPPLMWIWSNHDVQAATLIMICFVFVTFLRTSTRAYNENLAKKWGHE